MMSLPAFLQGGGSCMLFEIYSVSWICKFVSFAKLGSFIHYFFQYILALLSLRLQENKCWIFFIVLHAPKALSLSFFFFSLLFSCLWFSFCHFFSTTVPSYWDFLKKILLLCCSCLYLPFFPFSGLLRPMQFLGQGSDPSCSCDNVRFFNPLCQAGDQIFNSIQHMWDLERLLLLTWGDLIFQLVVGILAATSSIVFIHSHGHSLLVSVSWFSWQSKYLSAPLPLSQIETWFLSLTHN